MEGIMNTQVDNGQSVETIVNEAEVAQAFDEKAEIEAQQEQQVEENVEDGKSAEQDQQFASKFAALSRREKEIRQRERELESRLAELEAKLQEPEEVKEPEISLEERLMRNPLEVLSEKGLTIDKLTELALNDGKLTTDMQMELMKRDLESATARQIRELQERLDAKEKAEEEAKYEQTIQNFMTDLTDFVNGNESYELIKANDAVGTVYQVIEEHYNETGNILSNQEAADMVEAHLEEEAKRLFKAKKLSNLFEPKQTEQPKQQRQTSPTLSNTHTTQVSTKTDSYLSEEESKKLMADMLKWED